MPYYHAKRQRNISSSSSARRTLVSRLRSFHSVVFAIPTELPVQLREQDVETNVSILLAPLGEVGDRVAEFLSGRPSHDVRLAGAIFVPATLEPEEVESRRAWLVDSTEVNHSCLIGSRLETRRWLPVSA